MSKYFLSYRRSDTGWVACALHAELTRILGDGEVFLDVSSLKLGHSWSQALDKALDTCDVALVLIGPDWLECRDPKTDKRRLDDTSDFVLIEITRSLERGIPVIPILVDDTEPPTAEQLPDDLEELVFQLMDKQGKPVRQSSFRSDVAELLAQTQFDHNPALENGEGTGTSVDLRQLLIRFLKTYSRWSFSALRIANWGAQQPSFDSIARFSRDDIRNELESMVEANVAATRLSKKGGTLYRLV